MQLKKSTAKNDGPPWTLPSGVYVADVRSIKIEKASPDVKPVFTVGFFIDADAIKDLLSKEDRTPLDVPSASDVKFEFDTNDTEQREWLWGLVGRPFADKNGNVSYDDSGLVSWDGKTGESGRFSRKVEITIESKPGRPNNRGGWWQPSYTVVAINKIGTAAESDQLAMKELIETPPKKDKR